MCRTRWDTNRGRVKEVGLSHSIDMRLRRVVRKRKGKDWLKTVIWCLHETGTKLSTGYAWYLYEASVLAYVPFS